MSTLRYCATCGRQHDFPTYLAYCCVEHRELAQHSNVFFCISCGDEKPVPPKRRGRYPVRCDNTECRSRYRALTQDCIPGAREKHNEKALERINTARTTSRETFIKYLVDAKAAQCKLKDILFDLTPEDIETPEHCALFPWVTIQYPYNDPTVNFKNPHYPSLDRIDPNKGYVKNNVRIVCIRANRQKNNMTAEEAYHIWEDHKKYLRPDDDFWLDEHLAARSNELEHAVSWHKELYDMAEQGYDIDFIPVEGIEGMVEMRWVKREAPDQDREEKIAAVLTPSEREERITMAKNILEYAGYTISPPVKNPC